MGDKCPCRGLFRYFAVPITVQCKAEHQRKLYDCAHQPQPHHGRYIVNCHSITSLQSDVQLPRTSAGDLLALFRRVPNRSKYVLAQGRVVPPLVRPPSSFAIITQRF